MSRPISRVLSLSALAGLALLPPSRSEASFTVYTGRAAFLTAMEAARNRSRALAAGDE